MAITELSAEQLKREFPLEWFPFETTHDLQSLEGIIGQERALRAIELAMGIQSPGYNLFVSGVPGTGRTTIVRDILQNIAAQRPVPNDWCFVYNFVDPDSPQAISLPPGKGREFQHDMEQLIATLKTEIKRAFSSDHYDEQKLILLNRTNDQKRKLIQQLDEEARRLGLQIQSTPMGFQTVILKDGKPIQPEDYEQLSPEEKEEINRRIQEMEVKIAETVRALTRLDKETQKSLQTLNERVAGFVADQYINDLEEKYRDHPQVVRYLKAVRKDIIDNIMEFLAEIDKEEQKPLPEPERRSHFKRYKVNVVVDNSQLEGAPVIYETNPTYNNLIGRIEKFAIMGTYMTDFTMIKAGSLLRANGGYLMVDVYQLLRNPFAYDSLKRAIKNREVRIEDVAELYGFVSTTGIKPQPIPLDVKVVLIGTNLMYYFLQAYDEDFSKIFKVRADFDYETDASQQTIHQYAQFIKKVVEEEKLLPFHKDAVREVILYGHRLVEDQKKVSLKFDRIVSIIREAHFWAKQAGATAVREEHVQKAIQEYEYRNRLVEDKIQEMIERDIYRIQVDGKAVGQINGLSVISIGNYSFGRPNRITAKTYIGNDNVVHIERKARLSGKLHDKGVYILSGFFNSKFGSHIPLSFSASITFEQSYSMIDGDSASSTELFALISSLAEVPIKQGIAVTGSVNQNGEIQAIGGVNEKIEGYFRVCQAKGLNGEQGVIIPRSNVEHLMLKPEVVQAVQEGKFHIWAIDTVEDGLEILTGLPAGERNKRGQFPRNSIYYRVEQNLKKLARRADQFRKKISESEAKPAREKKKPAPENDEENDKGKD